MKTTKAQRLVNVLLVLAAGSSVGCTGKKLSKEEAAVLLKDVSLPPPTCVLEGGPTEAIPVGDEVSRMVTFDDAEWGRFASELGFLKDIKCDAEKTKNKCRGLAPKDQLECTRPLPYYAFGGCTFSRPCGSTALEVDSIVTDGNRATIRYSLKPSIEPKLAQVKPPGSMQFHVKGNEGTPGTATAVLTDDGRWILEK